MGLIASGKSTLAQAFAKSRGLVAYNSDVVRKELASQPTAARQTAAFAGGIYTPEFSRRTYDALLHLAAEELRQGRSVVLDASYHRRAERHVLVDFCTSHGYAYHLIYCRVSEEETRRRLALRAQDPHAVSDGTWEIYLKQKEVFEYPHEIAPDHFLEIVTDRPVNELLTLLANPRIFAPFSA